MKKAKVDAAGGLAKEKEKTARKKMGLDDARANRETKKKESLEREQKAKEQFKDKKKVNKVAKKAAAAQTAADDQKKKTGGYANAATSGNLKTASSTGSGTGASDQANAMLSNLGTVAGAAINTGAAIGSAIRAKQKQNKADKLAKKAKKKEKKFDKKYNEEVFYDWREEFLHEVEKKGDKKEKKIIDVLKGKNTIVFNPVSEARSDNLQEKPGDGYLGPTPIPNPIRLAKDTVDATNRKSAEKVNRVNKILPGSASMPKHTYFNKGPSAASKQYLGLSHEPEGDVVEASAAWQKKSGKNSKGGLNEKGRKSYEAQNPGSDLKAPVTGKVKAGGKAAKRRKSFCARMGGMEGPMKKPNGEPTRKALALRKWKC